MKQDIPPQGDWRESAPTSRLIGHIDQAILLCSAAHHSPDPQSEAAKHDLRPILDRLIQARAQILHGKVPEKRVRLLQSTSWMVADQWDPSDIFGNYLLSVMWAYDHQIENDGLPDAYASPEVDEVATKRDHERRVEAERPEELPPKDPEARSMPHHPDPKSMRNYLLAAQSAIDQDAPALSEKTAPSSFIFGQQYMIRGLVGYWLQRADPDLVADLRYGTRMQWRGIQAGYRAHIWDFQQLFLDAVAYRCDDIAQTRPVPWLTARLRCLFTLHRQTKVAVQAYFEDLRIALFVDVLPPELEPDVPLMRNSYWLLLALRDQQWPELERRLGERMELLVKHFWRNIAPVALADSFGLSVARWAGERGYRVQLAHVYLPLDWLDVPVAGTNQG
jgi:hypothetical protein